MSIVIYASLTFLLIVFIILYRENKNKSHITVESAIAGEIKKGSIEISVPIKIKKDIIINDTNKSYFIGDGRILPTISAGNSMAPKNIFKGDLVLLDSKIKYSQLKRGDVIAIRITDHKNENFGKIKLRLFKSIEKNEKEEDVLYVQKYNENSEVIDSKDNHLAKNILGLKVASFNKEFCIEFLDKNKLVS